MTKHYTYTQSQFGKYFTNVARIMRKCDLSLLLFENGEGHFHRLDKYYGTLVGYNLRLTTKMIVSLLFELFSMP